MQHKDRSDLTRGNILNRLIALSVPIMGSQLLQMAYNLTDMFWLGRVGSHAVAATGTVGMYLWLSMAFAMYGAKGAEIGVSQNIGRGNAAAARAYASSSLGLSVGLGVAFAAVMMLLRGPLVGFFAIQEAEVVAGAESYLLLTAIGIPATYVTSCVTGVFIAAGNSRVPFFVNLICVVMNLVLDPVLIFTAGLNIEGAALATVASQWVSAVLLLLALKRNRIPTLEGMRLFARPRWVQLRQIFRWATPIAVESFLFTFLSMIISRFVAAYGSPAMSAQRIGSQVESLSWLVAGGFSSAVAAFVGQNYGAGAYGRIHRGFRLSVVAMVVWGVCITALLYFFAGPIFTLFLPGDEVVLGIGTEYLQILAMCQLIACLEGVASGAFRGLGRTLPPSVVTVACNSVRVVAAWLLPQTGLGLAGIWWAISLGAVARGLCMLGWYLLSARKLPRADAPREGEAAVV